MRDREIFSAMLKDAKVTRYVEGVMTLKFASDYKARHFETKYKSEFETLASELFGKITVEIEN